MGVWVWTGILASRRETRLKKGRRGRRICSTKERNGRKKKVPAEDASRKG
jgi:hypothetical protein